MLTNFSIKMCLLYMSVFVCWFRYYFVVVDSLLIHEIMVMFSFIFIMDVRLWRKVCSFIAHTLDYLLRYLSTTTE